MANRPDAEAQIGFLALERELLNKRQMEQCRAELAKRRKNGDQVSLDLLMVELGFLTQDQLTSVRAEARRRLCRIRGYEILDEVGRGSVGTVFRARQIKMDRDVAIKILRADLARDPETVKQYIAEARAVAKLNHPHIVQGIDVGESDGYYFFAMEFLAGGSFADVLEEDPLDEDDGMIYLYQVASALKHAWAQGVIHCDIKPANLMLDDSGRLKLTDLGLAQFSGGMNLESGGQTKVVRGTPHYISPEQIETPDELDTRTDVYSLGATFYHLFSGKTPFSGKSQKALILSRLRKKPTPLHHVAPQLPEGLCALVDDMLARDRSERPANPDELMDRLVDLGLDVRHTGDVLGAIQRGGQRLKDKPKKSKPKMPKPKKRKTPGTRRRVEPRGGSSKNLLLVGVILVALLVLLALAAMLGGG